jgi:hypothetical protein
MELVSLELQRRSGSAPSRATRAAATDDADLGHGRPIVCAGCGYRITTEAARIEMDGRHEHHCVNPNGYEFDIGCFCEAPGCKSMGVPTLEFTLFAGFAWSHALCSNCNELLGWLYTGAGAKSFYGLILNRLTAEGDR